MDLNIDPLEGMDIVPAIIPVDLSGAANAGDWVNLRDYEGLIAVLFKGIGTAGQDPVFTLEQATAAAGTGAKALTFTRIRSKVGTLTAVGTWTLTTQTAAGTYTDAVSAEAEAVIAVVVRAAELDINNGFTWVRLSIPDVGAAAQLGCGFYILYGGRYKSASPLSAIA